VTEFLPISSSGHLVFLQYLFGMEGPQLFFDVVVHFGTLLAVVVFFRREIWQILRESTARVRGRKEGGEGPKLLLWILVASVPTGLMGLFFRDIFESLFARPMVVGGMLLVTGSFLWLTRYARYGRKGMDRVGWMEALLIGLAQGVAIIPGISRSGATISTGFFCGLNRELSGTFSFLLSIPAILGALLLEVNKIEVSSQVWVNLVGMVTAFCIGLLSLRLLMNIIRVGKIGYFSYYCWMIGVLMILLAK
jgi:undecaprenyl-diphosphatase